jgi:two-component system cell cycle sensor histidine kinase/response regulator CckA
LASTSPKAGPIRWKESFDFRSERVPNQAQYRFRLSSLAGSRRMAMTAVRSSAEDLAPSIPPGLWRYAAIACGLVALAAAAMAFAAPVAAGWPGVMFVGGIGFVAGLLLWAVRTRSAAGSPDLKLIVEAAAGASIGWAITDRHGAVLHANQCYRELAGADAHALPPPALAMRGDAAAPALYRLSRKAAAREPHEETFTSADGNQFSATVRPLSGQCTAWWFAPEAPTRSAERTSEGQAGSQEFFEQAPIGLAVVAPDGTIVEANGPFCGFFQVAGTASGRLLAELVAASDATALADAMGRAERENSTAVFVHPAERNERLAEIHLRRIPESERLALYLLDVSEQKALETRVAQSQKMQAIGQLAGGVAHDFNNLLTVIIGNSEFLLMRHPAGDPSFREINEVHQNALRAATLVGQLLAFSRQQTLQPRVLVLRDVIGELALMLRRLLREGVELKLEHGSDLWPVRADETQISNALINLVINARDAMPKGGTVTIATRSETVGQPVALGTGTMPPGDYVRIDVSDTGIGIRRDHLEKIFDPFFTTKPVGQGTGLGLATVYGIIKQTGGFVAVESEIGRGSTFRIFLPRDQGEIAPDAEAERPPPRDITGQETILLVEDEDAVRSFAARALKLRGYQVLEASGGEEALDVVRRHAGEIHLLITDVVMPNIDGPTLVRAVRRLRPQIAVIFMSGYAEEAFRRNDENAATLHFLPKPFGLRELAAKVKDVLSTAPAPEEGN